jgi:hypothetical protein
METSDRTAAFVHVLAAGPAAEEGEPVVVGKVTRVGPTGGALYIRKEWSAVITFRSGADSWVQRSSTCFAMMLRCISLAPSPIW